VKEAARKAAEGDPAGSWGNANDSGELFIILLS
jgi:hypothetical protein